MTPVYNYGAEYIIKIHNFYILFIFSSIISIFISNSQAFAVEGIWRDYNNLKELVKDIRNGDKDDDKMNYDKFKDSNVYKSANEDFRKCVDLANKVGEKLGDYEIVRCFENRNYFKEKYVDDNNQKINHQSDQNMTNQNQNGSEQAVQQEVQLAVNNNQSQQEQVQQQEQERRLQQAEQNVTNENQNGSEQAVQQEEIQLAVNNNHSQQEQVQQQEQERGQQQAEQNVTNQNQNGSEQAVQQEEVPLAENN